MLHSNRGANVIGLFVLLSAVVAWSAGLNSAATATDTKPVENVPVDINTASAEELVAIPGVGEATARRIIDWRDEHGPFRRVEDLMKIQGIGEKSLEKMRPHVTVGQDQ